MIAYQKWIPALMTARSNLRMRPEDPGPLKDKKVKEELQAQYGAIVDEGMMDLNKALEIDPEYDDAMAYLNLLIRERADLAGQPGRVQEADGDRRRLAAEGPGYQEDQGCARGQATHRDPHGQLTAIARAHLEARVRCPDPLVFWRSIHWYHWMPPESADTVPPTCRAARSLRWPSLLRRSKPSIASWKHTCGRPAPKRIWRPWSAPIASRRDRHLGQKRVSGEPYMIHPLLVTRLLADMHMDMVCLQTGLLHDVVEDTTATLEEVRKEFGDEVARCVDGVTKLSKLDLASREERQAESFRKMLLAMVDDIRVILVKLADRLHNMRTLGSLPPEQRRAHRAGDHRYLRAHRPPPGHGQDPRRAGGPGVPLPGAGSLRRDCCSEFEAARAANEEFLDEIKHTVEVNLAPRRHSRARRRPREARLLRLPEAQAPEDRRSTRSTICWPCASSPIR